MPYNNFAEQPNAAQQKALQNPPEPSKSPAWGRVHEPGSPAQGISSHSLAQSLRSQQVAVHLCLCFLSG